MTSVFEDPDKIKDDPETQEVIQLFTSEFKKARIDRNISQMQVGRKSNLSQKSISEIETGSNFKMNNYVKMCRAIGIVPAVKFLKYRPKKQVNNQRTASVAPGNS
jgi:DNA-binding XRE family transcriptional regulator